jgi:hypothetical protein
MEYKILVVLSNIFFVAAGWYLGREAGRKATIEALDSILERVADDVNAGRSLDWLDSENRDNYK